MYLLDSNILIELILEQEKENLVRTFLQKIDLNKLKMSDLSLHSIGIILFRYKKEDAYIKLINEVVIEGINILSLTPDVFPEIKLNANKFNLDFEDSYQYTLAKLYDLEFITFDKDFDKTDLRRFLLI